MYENGANLAREEKRDKRMARYLSGEGIKFHNARAEQPYKERVTRSILTHKWKSTIFRP